MNRVFADTFYFLAVLNRHDPAHEEALVLTPLQKERGRLAREFQAKQHAGEPPALLSNAEFCRGLVFYGDLSSHGDD
jgi:hypothetical protein